jgi:hypothetical protein
MYGEAAEYISGFDEKGEPVISMNECMPPALPKPYTFVQRLKPWGTPNREISLFTPFWRQFTFIVYPAVLWAVIFYGMAIGLGALYIGFSFSILITQPPWNWSQSQTGLNAISGFIGTVLAIPIGPISHRFAAWRTRKNGGVREPEMRLWVFLPAIICSPVGMAVSLALPTTNSTGLDSSPVSASSNLRTLSAFPCLSRTWSTVTTTIPLNLLPCLSHRSHCSRLVLDTRS